MFSKDEMKPAKPAKHDYRRNLPHIQRENKPHFVTFITRNRWTLPSSARDLVLKHCLFDHEKKFHVHAVVVMPDHVHMLFTPLPDENGNVYGLAEIMKGIKGASARSINKALKREGTVWQNESFDRVLRSDESAQEKAMYICQNPVRKGLVENENGYPWIWTEWDTG